MNLPWKFHISLSITFWVFHTTLSPIFTV